MLHFRSREQASHGFHCNACADDPRDADDAVRGRDGMNFDGNILRVSASRWVLESSVQVCS